MRLQNRESGDQQTVELKQRTNRLQFEINSKFNRDNT
ncbi:hypothetical protein J2S02_001758 [Metabacillus niabensis]|uniref:Uncharacterized protein n=1 Tax=Metabacillus niabensis TaxID=324854 RepID=A0ABT9YZI9_9BACI|nr:hypothetical protein [Metabacillus niabensis]